MYQTYYLTNKTQVRALKSCRSNAAETYRFGQIYHLKPALLGIQSGVAATRCDNSDDLTSTSYLLINLNHACRSPSAAQASCRPPRTTPTSRPARRRSTTITLASDINIGAAHLFKRGPAGRCDLFCLTRCGKIGVLGSSSDIGRRRDLQSARGGGRIENSPGERHGVSGSSSDIGAVGARRAKREADRGLEIKRFGQVTCARGRRVKTGAGCGTIRNSSNNNKQAICEMR